MPTIAIAPCRQMADYVESIRRAGAEVGRAVAHDEAADAVVGRVDGLLLTGGGDVDPALYGAAPHPSFVAAEPGRDAYEIALVRAALRRRSADPRDLPRHAGAERRLRRHARPGHPHRGERRAATTPSTSPRYALAHEVWVDADIALRGADEGRARGRRDAAR